MLLKNCLVFALFSTCAMAKNKKKPWSYLYTKQNCEQSLKDDPNHIEWSKRFNPNKYQTIKNQVDGAQDGARRRSLWLPRKVGHETTNYCLWMYHGSQGSGSNDQLNFMIDSDAITCYNFDDAEDDAEDDKTSEKRAGFGRRHGGVGKRRGAGGDRDDRRAKDDNQAGSKGDSRDDDEDDDENEDHEDDDENDEQGDGTSEESPTETTGKGSPTKTKTKTKTTPAVPTVGKGPYGSFLISKGG